MMSEWFTDVIKPDFDSFSEDLSNGDTWLYVKEIVGTYIIMKTAWSNDVPLIAEKFTLLEPVLAVEFTPR